MSNINVRDTPQWKEVEAKVIKMLDDEFEDDLDELQTLRENYRRLVSIKKKNGRQYAELKTIRQELNDMTEHFYDKTVLRATPERIFKITLAHYESY